MYEIETKKAQVIQFIDSFNKLQEIVPETVNTSEPKVEKLQFQCRYHSLIKDSQDFHFIGED
jgi:hypothetical protein